MFADTNTYTTIAIIALFTLFLSGLITWLYLRRAKSSQKLDTTWWQKYGQPISLLAITNFITVTSFFGILLYGGNESIQTVDDWLTLIIGYIGCFGCLFGAFLFAYLANLHSSKLAYFPWNNRQKM